MNRILKDRREREKGPADARSGEEEIMVKGLTRRQKEVLDFIVLSVDRKGFPPTLREIAAHFGLASVNAAR